MDGGSGTNYYVDYSTGTTQFSNIHSDPSGGVVNLTSLNEEKAIEIAGKHYTIRNNLFDFRVDFTSAESTLSCLEEIDSLIANVDEQLLKIGSTINRLEMVIDEQNIKIENMISSRSTMRDADIAKESSEYIRYQILQNATATLMASSRNIRYENVMGLLYGIQ